MNRTRWASATLAMACGFAALLGAAWSGDAHAGYVDCTLCHLAPTPGSLAKDYSEFFTRSRGHHSTGTAYPPIQDRSFFRPTVQAGDIGLFDRNGNGVADADEVQLFGAEGKVECASCHREHGDTAPQPDRPAMYVRLPTSQMCMVCHRI
jgi:hypothetical protein